MGRVVSFKEASFVEGRLLRISKRKVEIEFDEGDDEGPSVLALRLADSVSIDLDTIGEDVKAVIVDGKVARITPLGGGVSTGREKVVRQVASPQNTDSE